MRLFLTSSPCDDAVPAGCTLPCILFERNRFVEHLRSGWRPGQTAVVIAAAPEAYALNDQMGWTFHQALAWHGMPYTCTTVVDRRNADDLPQLIRDSSLVILGGGHVPTQNRFFHQLGLKVLLAHYPGTVMGISAGSMNCCGEVYAQPEEPGEAVDPDYERWLDGLALTDVMVLPHYQMVRDHRLDGLRLFEDITYGDSHGHTFYAIPDASYVLAADGQTVLYGEAYRIRDGVLTQVCREGECLRLR